MTSLRIGTRRSALARVQADQIRTMLGGDGELVPITTSGDQGAVAADDPRGLKGLWIDAILDALESGEIDLAVHSAKDLPAEDDDGFVIAAVPERADPTDVLITREAGPLQPGATIGTSALRRKAQLLAAMPDAIRVVDIRGNVDTRLRKLADGEVDALVLATAGLQRLGVVPDHTVPLGIDQMMPAPGQGCLAVQCRVDDAAVRERLGPLDHAVSRLALDAERSLMWRLGGGCALPLGAHATVTDGRLIRLRAAIATPDGARVLRAQAEGPDAEDVASAVAKLLIDEGAERILSEVRGE